MKKIVLLEFYEEFTEFQEYLKNNNLDISEFTLVALQLKLQAQLTTAGIEFSTSLQYIRNDAFERTLLKFEEIRRYIDGQFDFTDTNSIRNAYKVELLNYIEVLVYYIGGLLELLQSINKSDKDIEFYASSQYYISNSVFFAEDRMLGLLVEKYATRNNIRFRLFGQARNKSGMIKQADPVNKKISLSYLIVLTLIKYYTKIFYKAQILIPTMEYGFRRLVNDIKRRTDNLLYILPYDRKVKWYERYGGLISGIFTGKVYVDMNALPCGAYTIDQNILREKLALMFRDMPENIPTLCGIDVKDIVTKKVQTSLSEHLFRMVQRSHEMVSLVYTFDVRMFISPWGRDIWYITAELLKSMGKISLFISHGTHPVPINNYHEISIFNLCRGFMLGDYTHIAVATPVQESHLRYFKAKYKWIHNSEVMSGPLIFTDLDGRDRTKQRNKLGFSAGDVVLTHAASTKSRGSERYYFLETPDELFNSLSDVVDAINHLQNTRLIIRMHPGFYLSDQEIRSLLPKSNRYIINRTGPFSDVLAATDILISYSSTTIDEALLNRIPVLLYDKWDRYDHFRTAPFPGKTKEDCFPVCYVNNDQQLTEAMKHLMEKARSAERSKMNVKAYAYADDYKENFYAFVKESLRS